MRLLTDKVFAALEEPVADGDAAEPEAPLLPVADPLAAEPLAPLEPVAEALAPLAADAAVGLPTPDTPDTVRGLGGADADAPRPTRPPTACCKQNSVSPRWSGHI